MSSPQLASKDPASPECLSTTAPLHHSTREVHDADMYPTQEESQRIKLLKSTKRQAYNLSEKQWKKLYRKLDTQPHPKLFHLVQLLSPLDTPLKVQIAAGITDLPQQFEVQTCSRFPAEKSIEISVCRLEFEEWEGLRDKMERDGYERHPKTVMFKGEKRRAYMYLEKSGALVSWQASPQHVIAVH